MASSNSTTFAAPTEVGVWLSQGAAAGIFVGFLLPVVQMLAVRNPYNFLLLIVLPFFLFAGLVAGAFKALVFWTCTTFLPRPLGVVCRVAITVLLFGSLTGFLWWQWFSFSPIRSPYYSGESPSAVASLEGVRVIRLAVAMSAQPEEITEAQLRNLITHKLMDAGIEVVGLDSKAASQATLYVNYSFWNDLKEPDFYNSDWNLRLTQDVVLSREPHIRTEAPTWDTHGRSLSAGGPKHTEINGALDEFVRDYNRANSGSAAAEASAEASAKLSQLIWSSAYLIVSAAVFGITIGSKLHPSWRTLVYGLGGHSNGTTISAAITGILLRVLVVFLLMESILVLIRNLQLNFQRRDIYLVLLALAHCTLGLIPAFGRFKFVTLAALSFIAIPPVIFLFILQDSINGIPFSVILGYITLWMMFLLTRSSLVHSAFLNLKQELRYYLID